MNSKINWPLFERVVAAIKANPGHWDQRWWHCGTSHCFAGFCHIIALQDEGMSADLVAFDKMADSERSGCIFEESSCGRARKELGLTYVQGDWLFDESRIIEDFDECIERRAIANYDRYPNETTTVWPS